jgi:pyruvate formate lyase activating enzyme
VTECPRASLAIKGVRVDSRQIVDRALRLKPFFDHSGGGITLTGGEVTMQADFAAAILKGCKARGIHTVIETAGMCPPEALAGLLDLTDLVLYDIKITDREEHRRWTGASNERILSNVRMLRGRQVEVRMPLIPGITDTEENAETAAALAREAGIRRITLLPFNEAAPAKYEWLDRPFELDCVAHPKEEKEHLLSRLSRRMARAGVEITSVPG